jgi:hypothetical protein
MVAQGLENRKDLGDEFTEREKLVKDVAGTLYGGGFLVVVNIRRQANCLHRLCSWC